MTQEKQDLIIKRYVKDDIPATKVCKEFNCSYGTIYNILKRNGIKSRSISESKTQYIFNKDFFEKIDTEEKAYWLGFIVADGCVSIRDNIRQDLIISLAEYDFKHLQKFVCSLNGNNYISKNKIKCRIEIRSIKLCQDLLKLGIHPNKTFTVKIPQISECLYDHFWRGCVDGDGTIFKTHKSRSFGIGLTGNIFIINSFKKWIFDNFNYNVNVTKDHNSFRIRVAGKIALNILNRLYKDASVYLDRKYKIYQGIVKNYGLT